MKTFVRKETGLRLVGAQCRVELPSVNTVPCGGLMKTFVRKETGLRLLGAQCKTF